MHTHNTHKAKAKPWHNTDTRALCSKSNPQEDHPGLTDRNHETQLHNNFTLLNNRRTVENLLPCTRYLVVIHTDTDTHTLTTYHTPHKYIVDLIG